MKADFTIHSGWGDCIAWTRPDEFKRPNPSDTLFSVYGFLPERPRVGQTLLGEFERSWIKFEFISVDCMRDPPDQFFAKVRAIEQEKK